MIGVIRARFTPTDPAQVWSDTVMNNWLNPAIPFSLAHFWQKSSFGQADLRFKLFPPVVLNDPVAPLTQEQKNDNNIRRRFLVDGVINAATNQINPEWEDCDCLLIWFAQPTDLFGGGSYQIPLGYVGGGGGFLEFIFGPPDPPKKWIPVAVCSIDSTFDQICQELGHAFGIHKHPFNTAGMEYGDPYDSMSSRTYGNMASAFNRAPDPQLPVGKGPDGSDPQTIIGPLLSAANLYKSPFGQVLKNNGLFFEVPSTFETMPASFTLNALDFAAEQWPAQKLNILAVIPPQLSFIKQTYFLELRRNVGYDAGLRSPATPTNQPLIGVVIHYYDSDLDRIVYVDTLPITDNAGDKDYHVFGGSGFAFRITSIAKDFKSVNVLAGGGNFWRHFGLNIEESHTDIVSESFDMWKEAFVSPCFMFPKESYPVRHHYFTNSQVFVVSSYGYEKPGYIWKLNKTVLDLTKNQVSISVTTETPKVDGTKSFVNKNVQINYTPGANSLTFTCDPHVGNFSLVVEISVAETSPGVIKNFYEDRTIVTSVNFHNVELEWGGSYKQKQKECKAAIDAVNKKRIPQRLAGPVGPEPDPFKWPGIREVINELAEKNPIVANALINEVSNMVNVKKIEIIKRLE
jgi:hypothetical protein